MSESFVSLLDDQINYDFLFDDNSLEEKDKETESYLYKINVFGKTYLIAIGGKSVHPYNEEIFYHVAYVIYDDKVVFKLGIYEVNGEETVADIESLKILIDPRFYVQPQLLDQFSTSEEKLNQLQRPETGIEEQKEAEENMATRVNKEVTLVEGAFEMEEVGIHDMIKNVSSNGEKLMDNPKASLPYKEYYTLLNSVYRTSIMGNMPSELKDKYSVIIKSDIFKNHIIVKVSGDKKSLTFRLHDRIAAGEEYPISLPLLTLFEYVLKTKIILVSKDNEIQKFSLYDIPEQFDSSTVKAGVSLYDYYYPTSVMFVKETKDGSFVGMKYKGLYQVEISSLDDAMKGKIKSLFESTSHEYHENTKRYFHDLLVNENVKLPVPPPQVEKTITKKKSIKEQLAEKKTKGKSVKEKLAEKKAKAKLATASVQPPKPPTQDEKRVAAEAGEEQLAEKKTKGKSVKEQLAEKKAKVKLATASVQPPKPPTQDEKRAAAEAGEE